MKITKFGHCCLLIEEGGLRILTDPGNYTTEQNSVTGIDIVLITHEHQDHLHVDSLKKVLANNPSVKVYTNRGVAKLLDKAGLSCQLLEHGKQVTEGGVLIEAFGEQHQPMYPSVPPVANTGYFIGGKLFYPGDAFTNPGKPVDILALPITAPWLKMAESIDYAKQVGPRVCFPVHDGNYSKPPGSIKNFPPPLLAPQGITYTILELGKATEL